METRSNLPSWLGDTSVPERRSARYEWLQRLSPSEGWATFVLVAAMLFVVGWSVTDAGWVETPALRTIMFIAAVTGLLLAKVRTPAVLLHVLGLAVGGVLRRMGCVFAGRDRFLCGKGPRDVEAAEGVVRRRYIRRHQPRSVAFLPDADDDGLASGLFQLLVHLQEPQRVDTRGARRHRGADEPELPPWPIRLLVLPVHRLSHAPGRSDGCAQVS